MAVNEYVRLTRAGFPVAFSILSRSSLWLGKDHLLSVGTNGYTESYKRFYFRDIQAITIQRTEQHHWWTALFGVAALILALFAISAAPDTPMAQWTGGAMTGECVLAAATAFCIFLLALNFLFGPACKCFLRTAVQIEHLPSLNRVRRAQKTLGRLRPLIVAVQGELAPGDIPSRMHQSVEGAAPGVPESGRADTPAPQQP